MEKTQLTLERTQFTFYESFFKAISRIKKKADRAEAYDAICLYALYGTEPNVDSMSDAAAIAFELSKPNLDASRRKASSGKKGGGIKQTASKAEASEKQTESKNEANKKQTASKKEKEKEKEIEIENECYNPLTPFSDILDSACFGEELKRAVLDWLKYKSEKRQGYKKTGFHNLVEQIKRQSGLYGEAAVEKLIRDCMASNWQGIIFERLSRDRQQGGNMFMEMLEESYGTQ